MTKYRSYVLSALVACVLAAAPACGDDDKDDGDAEADLEGDCKTISDACHDVDEGEGQLKTCHELAHDNDVEACSAQVESCVEACSEHEH